jgi:hypothetical protein
MTSARPKRRVRPRGEIETLPSGSIRVRVAAGTDPVTKQRHRRPRARSVPVLDLLIGPVETGVQLPVDAGFLVK